MRRRKRLQRAREFARAVWLAVRYMRRSLKMSWLECARAGLGMVSTIQTSETVDWKTYLARLRACRHCHLYDKSNRVCGNKPDIIFGSLDGYSLPYGCRCWLPWKAKLRAEDCFLGQAFGDSRWPQAH